MKLIRRRKSKTPPQQALDYVRLALKALIAQRVARKAFNGYRFTRRLPLALAFVGAALVAKKLLGRKGGEDSEPAPYAPPAPTPTGAAPAAPGSDGDATPPTAAATTPATTTAAAAPAAETGEPSTDPVDDDTPAPADTPAATGAVAGGGPEVTPEVEATPVEDLASDGDDGDDAKS